MRGLPGEHACAIAVLGCPVTAQTDMKHIIARCLFACLCAVLLQAVLPDVTLAQRKLVRVACGDSVVVCLDSLFVEEGTIPHDSCEMIIRWYSPGDATVLSLLFTNFNVHVSYTGSADHAAQFKELSSSRGAIDSSNSYLLNDQVKRFLELLKESVGYESVVAGSIAPSNLDMGGPLHSLLMCRSQGTIPIGQ